MNDELYMYVFIQVKRTLVSLQGEGLCRAGSRTTHTSQKCMRFAFIQAERQEETVMRTQVYLSFITLSALRRCQGTGGVREQAVHRSTCPHCPQLKKDYN